MHPSDTHIASLRRRAKKRVLSSKRLSPYADMLLSDVFEYPHFEWLLEAPVKEIEGVAKAWIEEDKEAKTLEESAPLIDPDEWQITTYIKEEKASP